MIQINPLKSYIDGGVRAAITTPPSASLVFDLPGKAIWVKGVKLKGTDHTYTFSHDNYITLTNTPDSNESEDIKIGVNTSALKNAIDTTYGVVSTTANGLAPKFTSGNKLAASAATTYYFLGWTGSTLKWYQAPFRNIRINSETTDRLGVNSTDPLIISSGNGISVTWDSTNKKIVITNTKPDVNHNTHYTTMLYIGENNDTKANKNVANPYLKLFDDNTRRATFQIKAGSGIAVASDANGNITITNSSPDVNHNTDRTGIKLTTVSGTKKTDSTLILANSATGLNIQGGTNKFLIGDGTNYIEVPVTPSFTISNKDATIGTALTTIATIAGVDIKAKIASYSLSNHTHLVKINGSTKTITTSGTVDLGNYLPLSGGTMTGSIYIPGLSATIVHTTNSSSNYIYISELLTGSSKSETNYQASIGWHNTGGSGNGALILVPYAQNSDPWLGNVGLYIAQNSLKFNGTAISLSGHTHAWNSLTHSSTTLNQAILTNGSANGWKLYTLNISGWNNAANNAHSHSNKSVLDGITSTLVSNWNTAYNFVNTISGTDTDKVINKWDEIVNFLAGISEDNKLNTLLNSKLSVYELANNTNVGAIKNNGIYYSTSDASSGTLTNSPFNTGFALINMTSYDGGDDLRRSRLAFNAYGEIKVSNDRDLANTVETWYNILTSKNTYISENKGYINGTQITYVNNSGNATNATNARKLVNWYSTRPTSLNTQFGDGSLRIFHATASTTEGKSPDDATILHLAWDNNGGWDSQLGINSPSGRVYSRAQNKGTWQSWKTLAFTTDIPMVTNYYWADLKISNNSNTATNPTVALLKATTGVQIGSTADYGWYLYNNRICAGINVARDINTGSLLVSSAWADSSKVPTNGIYSKGNILTAGGFIKSGSSNSYILLGAGGHKAISDFATSGHNHNNSYVASVSISGNNLRINKNGVNTDLTIPYATNADKVDGYHEYDFSHSWRANAYLYTKFITITRSSEKGFIRLHCAVEDNSGIKGADYIVHWLYDGSNENKSITVNCLSSYGSNADTSVYAVRKSGTLFDLIFKALSTGAFYVGFSVISYSSSCTINNYSIVGYTEETKPQAAYTSSAMSLITDITGNATTASKLGTSTVGATNVPIYLNGGTPTVVNLNSTANNLINNLSVGDSVPADNDYYIAQYVNGGTTNTTYYRRSHLLLYKYIKNKAEGTWNISINGSAKGLLKNDVLDSQEKIDNFLTANILKYATFKTTESNNLGFDSNDGMILSIPWSSTSYGAQIAFDDTTSGTIKVRGKKDNSWGNWYTLLHSGNSNVLGGGSTWGSSITVNINGTSKTLTIPGNPNTDYRVTQSETTTANYRPLVLGYTSVSTAGSGMTGSVTNQVYLSNKFYVQPSTGNLYATNFIGTLSGNASTATKLQTSRNLWGNSFNGTADISGTIRFNNVTSGLCEGILWTCGDNDFARIKAGATGSDAGYLEIATADGGSEPIYVRQYSGVFNSVVRTLTLLDANGYTHFPSYINIGGNENNNSSPDRIWGSNGSDSYLRSYRTSALRVSYASSAGNSDTSNRTKFLETFKQGSTTNTYGTSYPIWAQWSNSTNVRLKCTDYTVWTDKADYATSAGNADTVDGLHVHSGRNNEANKIVRTDGNGFILAGWINTTSGDMGTGTINKIYCSDDNYIRYKTPANFFPTLANSGNNISITVAGLNRILTVGYATNTDKLDGYHAESFVKKHTEYNFNSNGTAPYNYVWLCRIGNKNGYSGLALTLDVNSRYHKHYQINILISTGQYAYSSSSISINKSDSAPDVYYVRTANGSDVGYDYFDIYVTCSAWNAGGYKIINTNVNGGLLFTNKCTLVDNVPSGAVAVGLMYSSVNYASSSGNADTVDGLHLYTRNLGINGTSWTFASTANANATTHIYAATSAGTSGQILKSTGGTPTWMNQNDIIAGKVTCTVGTTDVFRPIVLTNESNQLYYNTKIKGNYSTGKIQLLGIEIEDTVGDTPLIRFGSANKNSILWKVYSNDTTYANKGVWGFDMTYFGTGSGNANRLVLHADNQNSATKVEAMSITQDGIVTFSKTISGSINGNADTVDGQHFSYSNSSNSPTYLWATNSNGSSFLAARGSISVNYANSAGNADTVDGYHASSFSLTSHTHDYIPRHGMMNSAYACIPTYNGETGWHRIATIQGSTGYGSYILYLCGNWSYSSNTNAIIHIDTMHTTAQLTQVSGIVGYIDSIRLVNVSSNTYYVDVHINYTGANAPGTVYCYFLGNGTITPRTSAEKITGSVTSSAELDLVNGGRAHSASSVVVNNSDANSTYRMVWHSGNTLYGTNNIYCNPSSDQIYSAGFRHVSYNSASYLLRSDGGAAAFNWSGQSGQPTWLWGGNSQHTYYVYNPSNFNVNSAAVLRGNASNPNNSHPGHGAKVFYSWNTGQAGNDTTGYSNGITIGSNPGDTAYGFQIVQNMWDDRTYTRRYNKGWQSWKTLAWTSDIPTVTNYYWANVKVSASSSTSTSPTFSTCYTNNWFRSTGLTGWYSESYGGGIYMTDSTWVRIYNDKKFYVNNSEYNAIHSAGGVYVAGMVHSYANYLKSTKNGKYVTIGPQNSSHAHYETDATVSHWFNKRVDVNGAIWRYNTNYGIDSDGYFYAKGIYANRDGSSTGGGVSLYTNTDPMVYGIAFRGTGTYGTHGYVTSAGDWATYLTMNDSTTRGWIFRRGNTNVASIAGSGNMAIGLHLEFSNGAHISTNRSTDYHYGYTFNLLSNTQSIGMYSGPASEAGGVVISPDGCLIYNSSDCGYNLQVRDKDLGTDLTTAATLTFGIELSGYYAWSRGGFKKNGSSNSYVLLGGGGHKAISDFSMSHSHPYLQLAGGTMTGVIASNISSGSHISANKGNVIINSKAAAGFNMLARMKSTNGVFTHGMYNNAYKFYYTSDTTISAGTNTVTSYLMSLNEDGYVMSSHFVPLSNATYTLGLSGNRWTHGYFNSTLYIGATNSTATNAVANCSELGAGCIELSHSTPYIDFHYNKGTGDYTSRIIATDASCLAITSNLYIGGSSNTSYRLRVAGDTLIDGVFSISNSSGSSIVTTIDRNGKITTNGSIYATHFYENSDIRYKRILRNLSIDSNTIANLPLFDFEWIENNAIGTGTSALAVLLILPNIVSGTDKLTLDYGVLGTIAGITACKELVKVNTEIFTLKSELLQLKEKVKLLEDKLRKYENI